jgi:4-amino-4-deoxy-L-arabinose transferase-like glycosyltransferase
MVQMTSVVAAGNVSMKAIVRSWFGRYGITVFLICVSLLALGLRVHLRYSGKGYIFYGDAATSAPRSDAISLNIHALNLIAGRGFGDYIHGFRMASFIPPGHPLFLGLSYFYLGNRPAVIGWIIAILASIMPVFAYLFSREMFGRKVACVAALLVAVYPPYIRLSFSLMTEPSAIFITAIALWLLARLIRDASPGKALLAGFVFSIATLVRPSGMAFVFALSPWLLWKPSGRFRRRLVIFTCFALAMASLHVGWTVRNRVVHGKSGMPYSSVGVRHAWTGANPKYMPWFYSRGSWHETLWTEPYSTEIDRMFRLRGETEKFVKQDRTKQFFGCLWRLGLLFQGDLNRFRTPGGLKWDFNGAMAVASLSVWILAALGFVIAARARTVTEWKKQRSEVPGWLWVSAVSTSLVLAVTGASVYGASDRYRWPLEYVLIPFAALSIVSLSRIGRKGLLSPEDVHISLEPAPLWRKVIGRVLVALMLVLTLGYGGGLAHAYWNPPKTVTSAQVNTVDDVMALLQKCDLAEDVASQDLNWISYDDVFAERAANYGALTELTGKLVVWTGRLVYPRCSEDGTLLSAYFVVNPTDTDFGGARLVLRWRGKSEHCVKDPREGDIITLVARLSYSNVAMLGPVLEGQAMMRGQFSPPETDAGIGKDD